MSTEKAHLEELLLEGLRCERSDPARAELLAQEVLTRSEALGECAIHARALRNLAFILFSRGEHTESFRLIERAYEQAQECHAASAQALCLHTHGYFLHHTGKLGESLEIYRQAAELREALGETALLAGTLNNIGTTHFHLGDYDSCLDAHRQALLLWRQAANRFGEAVTLTNIGNVYAEFDDYTNALHHYDEALRVARTLENPAFLSECLVTIAAAYRVRGDLALSEQHVQEGWQIAQQVRNLRLEGLALEELGLLYATQRRYPEARTAMGQALRKIRRVSHIPDMIRLLYEIGRLHLKLNKPVRASRGLARCLILATRHQFRPIERDVHEALADAFEARGELAVALWHHRRFHALDRERITEASERQRLVLLRQIELEKAQREAEVHRLRHEELAEAHRQLAEANTRLQEQASRDSMTGLVNHRTFQERLRIELSRENSIVALLLLDVDRFKSFNDSYGHPAGDELLKQLAHLLCESVRDSDRIARYGGEEFAILLPGASLSEARRVAERIRQAVEAHPFANRTVTISIGIAVTSSNLREATELIAQADQALYAAKNAGRNCWKVASSAPRLGAVQ